LAKGGAESGPALAHFSLTQCPRITDRAQGCRAP
jgi:hypothetical protein